MLYQPCQKHLPRVGRARKGMGMEKRLVAVAIVAAALLYASSASAVVQAPDVKAATGAPAAPACVSPPPVHTYDWYHCYTPQDIAKAYGIDAVHRSGDYGQGQTIVLVDAYGSPTAAND